MRVIVVDEVRLAFRNWLKGLREVEVVGEAATGSLAEALLSVTWPDLAVVDLTMSEQRGVLTARTILERFPGVRVVALGSADDERLLQEATRVGASTYVLRDQRPEELLHVLRLAMDGRPLELADLADDA